MRKHTLLFIGACALALAACSDRSEPKMDAMARADADAAAPADADNTGLNTRDRAPEAVTPMDQSNSEADVEVTRSIRDSITSDDSMSIDAQNVKVISIDGVVTLRGPVEDEQEKAAIVSIATSTPGVSRVDDQLEIARD